MFASPFSLVNKVLEFDWHAILVQAIAHRCVHPVPVHRCDAHRSNAALHCMLMDRNGQAENLALAAGMGCQACQAPVHCLLPLSCGSAAGHATCTQSQLPRRECSTGWLCSFQHEVRAASLAASQSIDLCSLMIKVPVLPVGPQAAWQRLSASSCRPRAPARPHAPLLPSQRPRCASWGCLPGACRQIQHAGWCTASCRAPAEMARRRLCWSHWGHMVGTVTRLLLVLPQAACWEAFQWHVVQQFWPFCAGMPIPSSCKKFLSCNAVPPSISFCGHNAPLQGLRCTLCPGCRSQWPDSGSLIAAAPVHCAVAGQGHHLDHTGQHL